MQRAKKRRHTDTQSMDQAVSGLQEKYGREAAQFDAKFTDPERISTGIFPLDFALGGGFPLSRLSIVYGQFSSWKTNLVLQAIAEMQRVYPELKNAWVDPEGTLDLGWARRLRVDTTKLAYNAPTSAEIAIDMVDTYLKAPDCGIVVVDSIAAFIKQAEIDAPAGQPSWGGASILVGELVRRVGLSLLNARLSKRRTSCIFINQVRNKMGGFGGYTMPGGNSQWFASSLILRLWGKNKDDAVSHPTLPVVKSVTVGIEKWKQPIVQREVEFDVAAIPHKGLRAGQAQDWGLFYGYMVDLGLVQRNGGVYTLGKQTFKTQKQIRDFLSKRPKLTRRLQNDIISEAKRQTVEGFEGHTRVGK